MLLGEERGSRIGKWSRGGWHVCRYAVNIQSVPGQETCWLYSPELYFQHPRLPKFSSGVKCANESLEESS